MQAPAQQAKRGKALANYTIYVLGESQISISGGGQLDGVTQGDGSHLVGRTLTLNAAAWQPVAVRDHGGDTDFQDNDGNQKLDGTQTIDGVTYGNGTRVEAEYGLTLSNGVDTWQVVGFNVNNSSPAYGTVEGLAFIGGPGGFPPVGVPLTVVSAQEGPNYAVSEYATPICYCSGTLIDTVHGPRPVELLRPGDRVLTRDRGAQEIRWTGQRSVIGVGCFSPVEIPAGRFGATAPLTVSQQHRILVAAPQMELLFGVSEAFVPAVWLANGRDASLVQGKGVTYHHLLLDRHDVITANGVASESLFHGDAANEQQSFFPELEAVAISHRRTARPVLRRYEVEALMRAGAGRIEQAPALRHSA